MICFLFALVLGNECAMLIDAGSTGSKFWMYSWPTVDGSWQKGIPKDFTGKMLGEVKPQMEKAWGNEKVENVDGDNYDEEKNKDLKNEWDIKQDFERIIFKGKAMEFMKAKECEPKDDDNVPVWLLATGGLRKKEAEKRDQIFKEFGEWFASQVPFFLKEAKVLEGKEEAAYAWIAWVKQNNQIDKNKKNVGVLEMGGESFQVAFEPKNDFENPHYVKLFGETIKLYSDSFEKMGIKPIRDNAVPLMKTILRLQRKEEFPCLSEDYDSTLHSESTFKWSTTKCKYDKKACENLMAELFKELFNTDPTKHFQNIPSMEGVEFYAISNLQIMVDNLNLVEQTSVGTSPNKKVLSEQIEKYCAMTLDTLKETLNKNKNKRDKWDERRGPWACLFEHIVHHTVILLQNNFGLGDGKVKYIKYDSKMNTWPTGAFIQIMSNEHHRDNSILLDNSNPDNSKYDL